MDIRSFSKYFANLYVMVRRLANVFIGECSGYLRCLRVVYLLCECIQNVKDFFHKIKICICRFIWHSLTITYSFGKLAIWQTLFRKK